MGLLITSIYLMFIGLIATGSFLVSQTYAAKENDARMGSTWWSGASPGVTMVQYQNQTQISAAAYAEAYASACYSYMAPNLVGGGYGERQSTNHTGGDCCAKWVGLSGGPIVIRRWV